MVIWNKIIKEKQQLFFIFFVICQNSSTPKGISDKQCLCCITNLTKSFQAHFQIAPLKGDLVWVFFEEMVMHR